MMARRVLSQGYVRTRNRFSFILKIQCLRCSKVNESKFGSKSTTGEILKGIWGTCAKASADDTDTVFSFCFVL